MKVVPGLQHWKWTGDDLQRLTDAGFLPYEQRVELMDGIILLVPKPTPRHSATVTWIGYLLKDLDLAGFHIRQGSSLDLCPHFQAAPDVFVVRGHTLSYYDHFPQADDVPLVIEVAETSLEYDRGDKQHAYAAAGIPEYWIVNLREAQVEVFRQPAGEEYASAQTYKPGEALPVPLKPDAAIAVAALLGQTTEAQ